MLADSAPVAEYFGSPPGLEVAHSADPCFDSLELGFFVARRIVVSFAAGDFERSVLHGRELNLAAGSLRGAGNFVVAHGFVELHWGSADIAEELH